MTGRPCQLKALRALLDPRTPVPPLSPAGQVRFDLVQEAIASPDPFAALAAIEKAEDATNQAKGTTTEKVFATLRARAAMAGVELYAAQEPDGRPVWVCTKWAESTSFANLAEVAAWLDRIDGGRP